MDIKPHIPDPSVGLPASTFLKSLAQNDYNIDGKVVPWKDEYADE